MLLLYFLHYPKIATELMFDIMTGIGIHHLHQFTGTATINGSTLPSISKRRMGLTNLVSFKPLLLTCSYLSS
ncbi:MAG: hypothetical protein Q4B79_02000 [Moraxella sp.]|uniref:hypothetical protein n=1 Tax=Moraxella sp. TaxID=479 RepID=UPI0026DAEAE1|nr:hypothetical protein [Moraxella sp.]MDO4449716.1 hypothetical protein [Moraxella sp.]